MKRSFAALRVTAEADVDVARRHFIPDGESFHLKQIALAEPARKGIQAVVSVRIAGQPESMVLGTLSLGCEQMRLALQLTQDMEAVISVTGMAVDISGFFCLNGESYNTWGADDSDEDEDEDEVDEDDEDDEDDEEEGDDAEQESEGEDEDNGDGDDVDDEPGVTGNQRVGATAQAPGNTASPSVASDAATSSQEASKEAVQVAKAANPTFDRAPQGMAQAATADAHDELSDMHLTCKDCHRPFVFTVAEQEAFLRYGYSIPRIRCKPCSEAKKLGNYDKTGRGAVAGGRAGAGAGRGSGGKGGIAKGAGRGRIKGGGGKGVNGKGNSYKGSGKGKGQRWAEV